jgi:pantothenate kinase type III
MNERWIAADFGNTRLKLLVHDDLEILYYGDNWLLELEAFFKKGDKVYYSSVKDFRLKEAKKLLKDHVEFINAVHDLQKEKILKYKHIKGIGHDRLFGLLGAADQYGFPVITIDSGTATTINIANHNGICLGGAIMPGLSTQLKSLNLATEGLSKIHKLIFKGNSCGSDTAEAMSIGIIRGSVGAIKEIVTKIVEEEFDGEFPSIVITGGNAKIIYIELYDWNKNIKYDEALVLHGINKMINDLSK